jgi:hypothetical protein
MSQYLNRIDASLGATNDPFVQGELRSRKAAYLARVGRFDEAKSLIAETRVEFSDGRSGRVTCLLMVAEGAVLHYEQFSEVALDRIARALLLAQAMRDPEIIAVTAAWKAYLDFELSRFESMRLALKLSLESAGESDHTALTRCALLKSLGAEFLGLRDAAKSWFKVAHRHAIADGDQASIDALIFNKAAFALARQRLEWARGRLDVGLLPALKTELQSAKNLCQMVGITSFAGHIELSIARLVVLQGDYVAARDIYSSLHEPSGFKPQQASESAIRIETAYCHFGLGQHELARAAAADIDVRQLKGLDPDEQVVALMMWKHLVASFGTAEDLEHAQSLLEQANEDYERYESRIEAGFEGLM